MTALYELREKIMRMFSKYEIYIQFVLRFIFGVCAFMLVNSRVGYMTKLNNPAVCTVLALVCCIFPVNAIILVAAGMILIHLYALSMEVCIVGAALFLLMFLLYFRFTPKDGAYTILTPVAYTFQVPYIMPVSVGLLERPYSLISTICGTIVYYFLEGVKQNETVLGSVSEDDSITEKIKIMVNQMLANREMYLMCAAFVLSGLVIYMIRRLSVDHAWTLAVIVGSLFQIIVVLCGELFIGINVDMVRLVAGVLVAAAVGIVIKFFCFNLDYTRTERVQFEDDEYYYYVKAVPKIYMPESEKKIKKINSRDLGKQISEKERINKQELASEMDIDEDLLK